MKYVSNERQWLLIQGSTERLAFLHVYVACQSRKSDEYLQWNEDLFHLLTEETILLRNQGFTILALGDFNTRVGQLPGLEGNTPDTNKNFPMFMTFIQAANLVIINTLPITKGIFTRFMNGSNLPGTKSLLDYCLRDSASVHTVSSFIIDADARYACGSDHALLEVEISFGHRTSVHWSVQEAIQYNFTTRTNFKKFRDCLDMISSSVSSDEFASLSTEAMLSHLVNSLRKSGIDTFGLKTKRKKTSQKLPSYVLELIKTKNFQCKRLQEAYVMGDELVVQHYVKSIESLKSEIKTQIGLVKIKKRQKIRSKLLRDDPCRRKFWSFLRSQMSSAGILTSCYNSESQVVFDQNEIEDAVVDHFSKVFKGQKTPVFGASETNENTKENETSNDQVDEDKYEAIICAPMTMTELDSILLSMKNEKASGVDQIPPEFLKNSGIQFKQYLLLFYNKIIQEGVVPAELNIGKCCLIWKVYSYTYFPLIV